MQSDQLSTDQRWIIMLRKQLKDAEVEIAAHIATTTVTLGQIRKFKTGTSSRSIPKIVASVDDVPLYGMPLWSNRVVSTHSRSNDS